MNVHFGERLAEERVRLGLSQAVMAQRGGVATRTYSNYEAGEREPGIAALANWYESGVDVLYVVTGRRSGTELPPDEELVLGGFRKLDARGRAGVLALISGMQDQPLSNVRIKGEVGQYVEGDLTVTQPFTINMGRKKKKE